MKEKNFLANEYAARDIAHRWFAFFEGGDQQVPPHMKIFFKDY